MKGFVRSSVKDNIGTIEFHHPKSNSMPYDLLQKLANEIHLLGKEPSAKVIVLKSKGDRVFCAGASLDELLNIQSLEEGKTFFMGFAHVLLAMRNCPKFIIGRVQGKTVGGGLGIASATDYCFAVESSWVKLSELALGIGPFVIEPALKRKIGISYISELIINTTQWRHSQWAKECGLFNEVYPNIDQLDKKVLSLARELSKKSALAMRELKKIFWEGTEHWNSLLEQRAEISGRLVLLEENRKTIEFFKNNK